MKHILLLTLITSLFSLSLSASPLHDACKDGKLEEVKKIIRNLTILIDYEQIKKVINAKDRSGFTPLHHAALWNKLDIVKLLIANGADVNAKDNTGYTPLHWAAMHGHLDIVKFLVEYCTKKGITLNMRNNKKLLPQDLALQVGHRNIYNYLINAQKQLILNRLGSMTNVFGV